MTSTRAACTRRQRWLGGSGAEPDPEAGSGGGVTVPVRIAANFVASLEAIEAWWADLERPSGFGDLLDLVFEAVVPNLADFPDMGVDLLARPAASVEVRRASERLAQRVAPGDSLRQYVAREYLVLYLRRVADPEEVVLLAVRHHKQLAYDLTDVPARGAG